VIEIMIVVMVVVVVMIVIVIVPCIGMVVVVFIVHGTTADPSGEEGKNAKQNDAFHHKNLRWQTMSFLQWRTPCHGGQKGNGWGETP
jgi:hypothetical protein